MNKPDPFTLKRMLKFAEDFRHQQGQLATLTDFEKNGFPKTWVAHAVKLKKLSELYVTLTTGAVVKGYKPAD